MCGNRRGLSLVSTSVGERSSLRPGEMGRSSHVCWSYASDHEHRDFLVEFFEAGLAANERLMYIAPPDQRHATLAGLMDAGIELGTLLDSGALRTNDLEAAYLIDGALRPDVRLAGHALLVGQALRDGYTGLRVCSEIVPLLGSEGRVRRMVRLRGPGRPSDLEAAEHRGLRVRPAPGPTQDDERPARGALAPHRFADLSFALPPARRVRVVSSSRERSMPRAPTESDAGSPMHCPTCSSRSSM